MPLCKCKFFSDSHGRYNMKNVVYFLHKSQIPTDHNRLQGDYRQTTSSSALVSALGWDSLHSRRLLAQCVLFYKIHHHLVNMPFPPEITQASYIGRQDHELKYTVPRATIDPYKYSFYPRAIRTWNHLPRAVVITADPTLYRGAALPILRTMQPPVGSAMI